MYKSISSLCEFLQIKPSTLPAQLQLNLSPSFPFKVPKHFARQMEKKNPRDPLLLQVLPLIAETTVHAEYSNDPVGDLNKNPVPSLIHKYHGRALLITSQRCDIHCRYCFRQHFPYEQSTQKHWQAALRYIEKNPSIEEVILSGGDPLTLSEASLVALMKKMVAMPQITTLRIHSRTPVVAPARAPSSEFLAFVKNLKNVKVVLVVHTNHANELSDESARLFKTYQQAGITLLNQTVLLKGINNTASALINLSKALFKQGVLPYYCHLLDKVSGSAHFDIAEEDARQLLQDVRTKLPGYLVPLLVKEQAGQANKTPV